MTTLMIESYEDLLKFMKHFWRTPKDFDKMPYLWSWEKNQYPLDDLKEVVFKMTEAGNEWIPSPQAIVIEMSYQYRYKRAQKKIAEIEQEDREGKRRLNNLLAAALDPKFKF